MPVFIDDLLSRVEKPARYTGGEMNATTKSFDDADVTFAFCFPDTYEVAMSHLGMKILYGILNDLPYALCERVCMPWTDMRRELKAAGRPLFSLESRTPLNQFDLVGFTLQYEMSYTNILTMLKLAASCLTEMASENVYLAAIGPDMELTIIMEEDAPSILPCFDEGDALISVKGAPLFISYNPAQVLKLAGKRYLTGPVIFYRTDGHSTIVSLTVEDIYRFQTYLESHSTTLMADGQKLTCICID